MAGYDASWVNVWACVRRSAFWPINLLGAFLLGLLVGAHPSDVAVIALGTGLLGSFTTFSTWMVETDALFLAGRWNSVLLNIVGPVLGGLVLVAAGFAAGSALI